MVLSYVAVTEQPCLKPGAQRAIETVTDHSVSNTHGGQIYTETRDVCDVTIEMESNVRLNSRRELLQ